jgi:hypothetical protein
MQKKEKSVTQRSSPYGRLRTETEKQRKAKGITQRLHSTGRLRTGTKEKIGWADKVSLAWN